MEHRDARGLVHRTRHLALLALTGVAVLSLTACGSDSADATGTSADPAVLVGKTYLSDESSNRDVPGGGPLTLAFGERGQISANGGCNGHGGTATFDGDQLTVGALVGTMMACPPPRDTVDRWITELFAEPLTWKLDSRTLTLRRGDLEVTLNERVTRAVAGTTWRVTSLVRKEAVETSAVLERVKPTVRIGADGMVTGFSGCNRMNGTATVTGTGSDQHVQFGPIATTRAACAPEVMDVERAVLAVLSGDTTASVDGDVLRLTNVADPSIGLRLTATPEQPAK